MPSSWHPSTRRRLTFAPVASSAWPKRTSSPDCSFATRSFTSSPVTDVRVISSMFCSSHHSFGRKNTSSRGSWPVMHFLDSSGRLYGGSGSRPTSRIEPSAPSSRSQRAQLPDARPPPIRRQATERAGSLCRSRLGLLVARPAEALGDLVLEAGVQHQQQLVAGLYNRVGQRHEAGAVTQDRDDQRAVRQAQRLHFLAVGEGAFLD